MVRPVTHVAELDGAFWAEGRTTFDHYVSPWLTLIDDARFQRTVDRVEALNPSTIVGCHTPVISGRFVGEAITSTRRAPAASVPAQSDQAVLERIQGTLSQATA
jgi:hypothetical protein